MRYIKMGIIPKTPNLTSHLHDGTFYKCKHPGCLGIAHRINKKMYCNVNKLHVFGIRVKLKHLKKRTPKPKAEGTEGRGNYNLK